MVISPMYLEWAHAKSMKKIYSTTLYPTSTEGEYAWVESTEAEHGDEWDGDVLGYVENLINDNEEALEIVEEVEQTIHNRKPNAVFIVERGRPIAMFWAE